MPKLKLVNTAGVGLDQIDVQEAFVWNSNVAELTGSNVVSITEQFMRYILTFNEITRHHTSR